MPLLLFFDLKIAGSRELRAYSDSVGKRCDAAVIWADDNSSKDCLSGKPKRNERDLRRKKMMMPDMMSGFMMPGAPLLWILIGLLVGLMLVAPFIQQFARRHNERRTCQQVKYSPLPQDAYHTYEQGYQPPQPTPETYQEGGQQYSYPQPQYEQPAAQYPQEMPLQH